MVQAPGTIEYLARPSVPPLGDSGPTTYALILINATLFHRLPLTSKLTGLSSSMPRDIQYRRVNWRQVRARALSLSVIAPKLL